MYIHNLKVNGVTEPLGYQFDYLTFSWQFEAGTENHDTLTFLVEVAKDAQFSEIIWSEITDNHYNTLTSTTDFLSPSTTYFWRVSAGNIAAKSWFETGKMDEKWTADWISYEEDSVDAVTFNKDFTLSKKIKKARLYALGLGVYEALLNGKKIGNEFLTPGYHSYDLIQQYQTYDVTKMLRDTNTLTFSVGNGWYKGRFVFEGGFENIYGDKQKLIAELHIVYEDGSKELIVTDNSWNVATSIIKENSIYDGEKIDFSEPIRDLSISVDSSGKELLTARLDLPVGVAETFEPRIFQDAKGQLILDYGQEITGWIEGELPEGKERVAFYFAEILQNGSFYTDNLRTAKQEFVLLNNLKKQTVRPHFTFYGFRYVKVEGLTAEEAQTFKAKAMHSLMDERFSFESSYSPLNQLMSNIRWSQKDNFLSIPTDCPQRDERMGWTGDITVFSNTASYNMETRAFLGHFLKMIELEQKQLGGAVPFFAPFPKVAKRGAGNPFFQTAGAAVWSDAGTVLPITLYKHFRDKGLLKTYLPIMMDWVDFVYSKDQERGGKRLWDFGFQLGDWLALDMGIPGTVLGATDSVLIASVYYYLSATYTGQALTVLKDSRSAFYMTLADEIKEAILKAYYIDDQLNLSPITLQSEVELQRQQMGKEFGGINIKTFVDTQTGLSLLLRYHLYPTEKAREHLVEALREKMAENKGFLTTGFAGTPELPHALLENGLEEEAFELLFKTEAPSWLFEVGMGATTTWERWDSLLPDGSISGIDMNSMNHYAYGSIEDFIIEKLIGINPPSIFNDSATYHIKPHYAKQLEWVKGGLMTPNGLLEVSWKKTETDVKLIIHVPSRTTVLLDCKDGSQRNLTSGIYSFLDI